MLHVVLATSTLGFCFNVMGMLYTTVIIHQFGFQTPWVPVVEVGIMLLCMTMGI